MPECFGIFTAVRDQVGEIVDFRIDYVNDAACEVAGLGRDQQVGRTTGDIAPGYLESDLFRKQCQVVETGEPLAGDDATWEGEIVGGNLV